MSLNSLTNDELRRRVDFRQQVVPKGLAPNTPASRAAIEAAIQGTPINLIINGLIKYIPTEIITLYVPAASATPALHDTIPFITAHLVYWGFGALTPLLLLVIYFSKRAANNLPALPPLGEWPWWKMTAATIAFLVWALAVPNNPYVSSTVGVLAASLAAVVVSAVLSALEPIFEPAPPVPAIPPPATGG